MTDVIEMAPIEPNHGASSTMAVPARWAWAATVALWVMLALLASLALWHLRREAIDAQARELGLLARALGDETDRGLRGVEDGLRVVRRELQQDRLPAVASLRAQAELMPLVSSVWLVGRDGRLLAASHADAVPPLAFLQEDAAAPAEDRVVLSGPVMLPGEAQPVVLVALPVGPPRMRPSGWLLASVAEDDLLGAFAAATPASGARVALFRSDGVRLAGAAADAPAAGDARILSVRHVLSHYGVRVLVTRDLDGVLRGWRQTAQGTAAALLVILAALAAAVHFALLAARRRAQAEHAMQAQLARAGRLQALGTLAGGVAHDFNNVLAAIVGYGEMARDAAPSASAQARHLDKVLQAALRGKALVERILGFSRGGARASTVFELQPVVEEVLALLSASLRPAVVLERALAAPDACLRGDPTRTFEAVMNLCTNAMQAMPHGGMLTVELRRIAVDSPRVLSHSVLAPGRYLELGVADQGNGITPEVAEHLFEPFFTTRAGDSGTGLGLAVVNAVVAEFHGGIDVRSAVGAGARFTLYLPESLEQATPAAPPEHARHDGSGQRVLVVDDQPELVALVREMLEALGYEGVGHTDASAALDALRGQPDAYAALITDEVMPRLPGTRLAQAVRELRPDLPVLLVSGYGGAALAERAAAAGVTRVLLKPLQRAELARALQEVLG